MLKVNDKIESNNIMKHFRDTEMNQTNNKNIEKV